MNAVSVLYTKVVDLNKYTFFSTTLSKVTNFKTTADETHGVYNVAPTQQYLIHTMMALWHDTVEKKTKKSQHFENLYFSI